MTPERKELIDEGKLHENKLSSGAPEAVNGAIGYLIRCSRTQLFTECITDEECNRRMKNCPARKLRFGWPAFSAVLTFIIAAVGLILKFH